MMQSISVKGVWSLSNEHALKLLCVEHGLQDLALVQLTEEKPQVHVIQYDAKGESYIEYGVSKLYFKECMRL